MDSRKAGKFGTGAPATALLAGQNDASVPFLQRRTRKCQISLAFSDFTHAELHGKTRLDP
jgi:hypothetical protein